jgi:hypothetical protein
MAYGWGDNTWGNFGWGGVTAYVDSVTETAAPSTA